MVLGFGERQAVEVAAVPLEISKADGVAKALLIKPASNVVLQVAEHLPVHRLDLGAPLAAAAQRPLLQTAQDIR